MDLNEKDFLLSLYAFNNKLTDKQKIKKIYIMSNHITKYYNSFTIKKRNGKDRNILSPYTDLKRIQLNILNDLLYDKRPSEYAKAYIKNVSLIDNVKIHKGYKYILKLDISSFFENISYVDVFNVYKEYGFSDGLSSVLAHLTTYNEYLPQGAPTSPYLSNLVMREFDYIIGEWCEERNINYTRYSDDMTFSMNEYNKDLIRFVRVNLYKYGLELNNDKIQVDSKYRKNIRQEIYYINKYGIDDHIKKINVDKKDKYLRSLYGRILFVLSIDSKNKEFIKYKKRVREIINITKN